MRMNLKWSCRFWTTALLGCITGSALAQTTLYNIDFSSPYTVGALDGQQGFITDEIVPDIFEIEANGRNGQGVIYDMSTDTAGTAWAWQDVTEVMPANAVYVGTVWCKLDTDTLHPTFFSGAGLDVYGGTDAVGGGFARIATLQIRADNAIRMYSSTIATSVNTAAVDQWHRLDLVVDKGANKCYGLVDGIDTGITVIGIAASYLYDFDMVGVASGYNPAHFDDYSLTRIEGSTRVVQGRVTLGDFPVGPEGQTIYVDFLDTNDTVIATATGTADADGYFRAVGAPASAGSYRAAVRATHWLRKTAAASVAVGSPFVAVPPVSLINGDVDGDNVVSVFDYIGLSDAFDADSSSSNWNPNADLDGDGVVSVFDYIILSDNFDKAGD